MTLPPAIAEAEFELLTPEEARAALRGLDAVAPLPRLDVAPRAQPRALVMHPERAPSPMRELAPAISQQAAEVLTGALAFAEIDPGAPAPPPAWVEALGQEAADRRFRLAKAAWSNAKLAPIGLTIARGVFGAALKAESDKHEPPALNIAVQVVVAPMGFEEMEIE